MNFESSKIRNEKFLSINLNYLNTYILYTQISVIFNTLQYNRNNFFEQY